MLRKIALPNWYVLATLLFTFSVVMFLFYIDEGYYNFKWMKEAGAWIIFFVYWNIFFWLSIAAGFFIKYLKDKAKELAKDQS